MIDGNRALLVRLVALLAAIVGVDMQRSAYRAALARLRPLEAAFRRLIVIAAQGVSVQPAIRQAPSFAGMDAPGGSLRIPAFPLFDPRKVVGRIAGPKRAVIAGAGPQIRSFDEDRFDQECMQGDPEPPKPLDTSALLRRVARLERALGRLNAEAKRLARWVARHPKRIKRPMRPGRPPGFCGRRSSDPIQQVLNDLQILALRALQPRPA